MYHWSRPCYQTKAVDFDWETSFEVDPQISYYCSMHHYFWSLSICTKTRHKDDLYHYSGGTPDKIWKLFIDGRVFYEETLLENIFGTKFLFLNKKSNSRSFFIPKYFILIIQKTFKIFVPKLSLWHSYNYLMKFFV